MNSDREEYLRNLMKNGDDTEHYIAMKILKREKDIDALRAILHAYQNELRNEDDTLAILNRAGL